MKKLFQKFTDFFAFTKSERRGILALLGILGGLMIGIQIMPYCYAKPVSDYSDIGANSSVEKNVGKTVGAQNFVPQQTLRSNARNNTPQNSKKFQPIREKKPFTIHANTCDTLDLQQIRGIGSAFSKRIIKYRDQLGGFVRKEQLLEVWGIDSAKYAQIEGAFIIDKKNIRKINLNTVTINDLKKHPYLDYYQAKAIVQTRDSQGLYKSIDDILKIALIDKETFELICEYLEI